MKKVIISTLAAGLAASSAFAGVSATADPVTGYFNITDPIDVDTTLTADKQYCLEEIVYVSDATLTIEAGTIIRGVQGVLAGGVVTTEPGTLVITRTGKIDAQGTPANPIVFTKKDDNADPIANPSVPVDAFGTLDTGKWGGVIILGNAPTNNDQSGANALLVPGTDFIEGIVEPNPADANPDLRGVYGGDDCHDSSGVMRYVSIRHGGFNLSAANEINGLTMGGVGAGTVLEFIEVIAGNDDGFEWFGGTVNSKFLLSAFNNDDAFDYDQGFCGLGQFWAVVQANNNADGDKGGEFDGDDQAGAKPFATPVIYNMTVIGTGAEGVNGSNGGGQIDYDNDASGSLFNSIIAASGDFSLDINASSAPKVGDNLLRVRSNIFHRDLDNFGPEAFAVHDEGSAELVLDPATGNGNTFGHPLFGAATGNTTAMGPTAYAGGARLYDVAVSGSTGGTYFIPFSVGAVNTVTSGLEPYNIGTFFTTVTYKGAFDPATVAQWTDTWTVGDILGIFGK